VVSINKQIHGLVATEDQPVNWFRPRNGNETGPEITDGWVRRREIRTLSFRPLIDCFTSVSSENIRLSVYLDVSVGLLLSFCTGLRNIFTREEREDTPLIRGFRVVNDRAVVAEYQTGHIRRFTSKHISECTQNFEEDCRTSET